MRSPRAAPPSPVNCGGTQCTAAPRLAAAAFAISAVLPSAAPAGGGTAVVLHGVGLRDFGPLMRCAWNHTRFGVQHTEASLDSTDGSGGAHALRCITPPMLVSGALEVRLEVSNRGVDLGAADVTLSSADERARIRAGLLEPTLRTPPIAFTAYDDPRVHAISPSVGPTEGGTTVEVSGAGFDGAPGLARAASCRFGGDSLLPDPTEASPALADDDSAPPYERRPAPHLHTYLPSTVRVPATLVNGTLARCVSPPIRARGAIAVEISINGVHFSTSEPRCARSGRDRREICDRGCHVGHDRARDLSHCTQCRLRAVRQLDLATCRRRTALASRLRRVRNPRPRALRLWRLGRDAQAGGGVGLGGGGRLRASTGYVCAEH